MGTRIFLESLGFLWLVYGLFCFFQPGYRQEVARPLGAALDAASTSYTNLGLAFELSTVAFCTWLLRRPARAAAWVG